jgi:hypothetical protein
MANALYPKWKQSLLQFTANNDLSTGTVRVALIDTGLYTYNPTNQFWSSASSAVVGTPQIIGSKTFTNGIFSGSNVTFTAVSGATVEALIIYIDTGNTSTSPLVAYIDDGVTGLPVTPNAGDITITWSGSGIFAL